MASPVPNLKRLEGVLKSKVITPDLAGVAGSSAYVPKAGDEGKFVQFHRIEKHADRNGNDDAMFKGAKVKTFDRIRNRFGYDTKVDKKDDDLRGEFSPHKSKPDPDAASAINPSPVVVVHDISKGMSSGEGNADGSRGQGLGETYLGFNKLKGKLAHEKGIHNPGALAAYIGRKKYGKKSFQKHAAEGVKEDLVNEDEGRAKFMQLHGMSYAKYQAMSDNEKKTFNREYQSWAKQAGKIKKEETLNDELMTALYNRRMKRAEAINTEDFSCHGNTFELGHTPFTKAPGATVKPFSKDKKAVSKPGSKDDPLNTRSNTGGSTSVGGAK